MVSAHTNPSSERVPYEPNCKVLCSCSGGLSARVSRRYNDISAVVIINYTAVVLQ